MKTYASGDLITNRYEVIQGPREKPSLEGGMGIVYICLDHQTDLPVVLKTFRPEYLPDRAARDRFLREGTTWVNLGSHPHVVRCYEVIRDANGLEVYLALELIAKEQGREDASLRSWLFYGCPLPPETALLFALQIARGMQHAVECIPGFVHRDLKPENVLVGADRLPGWSVNRLRITDFGLAGVLQSLSSVSSPATSNKQQATRTQLTHGIVGTPPYMAPEQWIGQPVGVYTDVYALGCILYEMLTGYTAADGNSQDDLAHAHCTGDLRPLPEIIPAPVHYLLARCLAFAPADRYLGWDNVEFSLRNAYATVTGESAPPPADISLLSLEERLQVGWSYNAMGIAYMDIGKATMAANYFEQAIVLGQAEKASRLITAGVSNLGRAYHALGDIRQAIQWYEKSLLFAREIGDQYSECGTLSDLGSAYNDLGFLQKSINFSEQALKIAREIGDRHREASALCNLGNTYSNLENTSLAITFHKKHLEIAQELNDWRGQAASLNNLGLLYVRSGDVRQAIAYHDKALEIDLILGDRRGEAADLGNLGNAYYVIGNMQQAIMYHEKALEITREIKDRRYENIALGNLGNAYSAAGNTQQAILYYEQALVIDREIGDRRGESTDLWNLADEFYRLGHLQKAIDCYEKVLPIYHEIEDQHKKANALGKLGNIYLELGNAQRAIDYHEQAIIVDREIGDQNGEGTGLSNLGNAYLELGDIHRAIGCYKQAVKIAQEMGDHKGESTDLGNLGNAYLKLGDTRHAISYYEQALMIAQEIGDIDSIARQSFNMSVLYTQQGDTIHALPLAQNAAQLWAQIGSPNTPSARQLIAQLQGGGPAANVTQQAFEAFQRADSVLVMRRAVGQFPFMIDADFLAMIEQFIESRLPPEHRSSFEERFVALQQIAAEYK